MKSGIQKLFNFKCAAILFFAISPDLLPSQNNYHFEITKTDVECDKASASLNIIGANVSDTILINWSNGQIGFPTINNIAEGDYFVNVKINSVLDTTLYFTIEKVLCRISISKQFTPNGDGYNDNLHIARTENFPNFELNVFNKWGQLIHSQRSSYTPWDGKWAGNPVPDGVYYYVFYYDKSNKQQLVKGDITIIR